MSRTRPVKANNPGSLDYHKEFTSWKPDYATPDNDGRLCCFKTPAHGVKRLLRQIWLYLIPEDKALGTHGWNTPRNFVQHWAPNNDPKANNNESEYAKFIATRLGITVDTPMSVVFHMSLLVRAVGRMEMGIEIEDATNEDGSPWGMSAVRDGMALGRILCMERIQAAKIIPALKSKLAKQLDESACFGL